MGKHANRALAREKWPDEDRRRWEQHVDDLNIFDEGDAASWSAATRYGRRSSYGKFLGYVAQHWPDRLHLRPELRTDRKLVTAYAEHLLRSSREMTVAVDLDRLAYVMRAICPRANWSFIKELARRTRHRAAPIRHAFAPSDALHRLAIDIMDRQILDADAAGAVSVGHAEMYRDGLLMAVLANIAPRRATIAALTIGKELVRAGSRWALDIPAEKTKGGRTIEFELSERLSGYVDTYLTRFRPALPGADMHDGLWPAVTNNRPMPAMMIYRHIRRLTKKALGVSISPHRFRNAAATFLAVHDPKNVTVAADLLHHVSFTTTTKHYIRAQSRLAGDALARAILRKKSQFPSNRLDLRRKRIL